LSGSFPSTAFGTELRGTERSAALWYAATLFRRLHPTVLLMASAHMVADGYGNIYAPLLPLLIPKLGLSLAAAGMLTML